MYSSLLHPQKQIFKKGYTDQENNGRDAKERLLWKIFSNVATTDKSTCWLDQKEALSKSKYTKLQTSCACFHQESYNK